jgi:ribosomal protein S27AE
MNFPKKRRARRLDHETSLARRQRVCTRCGKGFLADYRHARRKFCSIACSTQNRRKLSDAQLRAIRQAVRKRATFRSIAARHGVTPQHIGYLAKQWRRPRSRGSRARAASAN